MDDERDVFEDELMDVDDEQGPAYTCEVCGRAISALSKNARRGTSAENAVSACEGCGTVYRWGHWGMNRWKGDTGTAFGPRLERRGN